MKNKNVGKTIGDKISDLLAEQGKMQKGLAEELDVLPNVISYFCKGTRTPNTEQLIKISCFFNVSADYLLGLSEVRSYDADLISVCQYTGLNEEAVAALRQFNTKEHKDLMGVLNRLISEGVLTDMARILSAKEQVKYLKYDFMDFMVNLANKFVRR